MRLLQFSQITAPIKHHHHRYHGVRLLHKNFHISVMFRAANKKSGKVEIFAPSAPRHEEYFNPEEPPGEPETTVVAPGEPAKTFVASEAPLSGRIPQAKKTVNSPPSLQQPYVRQAQEGAGPYKWFAFAAVAIAFTGLATSVLLAYSSDAGEEVVNRYLGSMLASRALGEVGDKDAPHVSEELVVKAFEAICKLSQNNSMFQLLRKSHAIDCFAFVLKMDLDPKHLTLTAKSLLSLIQESMFGSYTDYHLIYT